MSKVLAKYRMSFKKEGMTGRRIISLVDKGAKMIDPKRSSSRQSV
jgi:hypothetical protein